MEELNEILAEYKALIDQMTEMRRRIKDLYEAEDLDDDDLLNAYIVLNGQIAAAQKELREGSRKFTSFMGGLRGVKQRGIVIPESSMSKGELKEFIKETIRESFKK